MLKVTDLDSLAFDEDGNLKDHDELVKGIKEEWSDFLTTEAQQGAQTPNPPQNSGGSKLSRSEIYKKDDHGRYVLTTAERQKALAENLNTI